MPLSFGDGDLLPEDSSDPGEEEASREWSAPDHSIGLDESEHPPPVPVSPVTVAFVDVEAVTVAGVLASAFPAPAVAVSAVGEPALMAAAQAFRVDRLRGGCGARGGGIQPCGAEA